MLKKLIFPLFILLALFLGVTYLWLPLQLQLSASATARAQPAAVGRVLQGGAGEALQEGVLVEQVSPEAVLIRTTDGHRSAVALIASGGDQTLLQWSRKLVIPAGPLSRWQSWKAGRNQETLISEWLERAAEIASEPHRLYGMKLEEIPVRNHFMLTATGSFRLPPSPDSIYALAAGLRAAIHGQGLRISDSLMVHEMEEEGGVRVRVAFPVERPPAPGTPGFVQMVKGSLLRGAVQGGPAAVKRAKTQMQYYLQDGGRVAPAIPFEVWETNRQAVKDTSAWRTRIYFPLI